MRKSSSIIGYAFVAILCCSIAASQEFAWRDASGKPAPDTDARKSSRGFAGWLLTTADPDWKEKWKASEREIPPFSGTNTVRRGEKIYTLIFIVNPKPDSKGAANVLCDLKITRPNGTPASDKKNLDCIKGKLPGSPYKLRLAAPVIAFTGDPEDPVGTWRIDVTLHDVPSGVTLDLHTSFDLLDGAKVSMRTEQKPLYP